MESKLANFRQQRINERKRSSPSELLKNISSSLRFWRTNVESNQLDDNGVSNLSDENDDLVGSTTNKSMLSFLLKSLIWISLLVIFVRLEFGTIFFICSLFYWIFVNLDNRSTNNRLSAYSVFNRNCERIQGTFTAEDYDRQLRHGGPTIFHWFSFVRSDDKQKRAK